MSLRAQRVRKKKDQKTIEMQYGNLELFAKSKEGKSKWEGECGLWDMDGRIFLEKVAPEQNFENK